MITDDTITYTPTCVLGNGVTTFLLNNTKLIDVYGKKGKGGKTQVSALLKGGGGY